MRIVFLICRSTIIKDCNNRTKDQITLKGNCMNWENNTKVVGIKLHEVIVFVSSSNRKTIKFKLKMFEILKFVLLLIFIMWHVNAEGETQVPAEVQEIGRAHV